MVTSINSLQLIEVFKEAEKAITSKKEILNNLNVYPVPDGDTGTNMSLTLKEVVKSIDKKKDYSLDEISEVVSESSLMGGRGNSGVILSQYLSGFCNVIRKNKTIDKKVLLEAFQEGVKEAYASVSKPVEGTILTVMKAGAEEFEKKIQVNDITRILQSVINRSQFTLKKTPDMLPKLKEAGVVDAGGAGFVYFLEGFYRAIRQNGAGEVTATDDFSSSSIARIWEESFGIFGTGGFRSIIDFNVKAIKFTAKNIWWLLSKAWHVIKLGGNLISIRKAFRLVKNLSNQLKWQNIKETNFSMKKLLQAWQETPEEKFCITAFLSNVEEPVKEVRNRVEKIGSSVVIAQTGKYTKLHFHTKDKENAKSFLENIGKIEKLKIDDLRRQHKEFIEKKLDTNSHSNDNETRIITVLNGEGFKRIYKSFNGVSIIDGGETMNPSVADFEERLNETEIPNIIILPNNKNVFLAAKKAAAKNDKSIKVLETYDQAQGLAALLNFNPTKGIKRNVEMMKNYLSLVETFSITKATRGTTVLGKKINKGEFIALTDKKFLSKGKSIKVVLLDSLKQFKKRIQLITLYFGRDITKEEAQKLKVNIRSKIKYEVQLQEGGQPHYHYIVSLE